MPVYIVTGDGPRCGSSMMMQALKAGGMQLAYSPVEEQHATTRGEKSGYCTNPGGRWEVAREAIDPWVFPGHMDGIVVKIFPWPSGVLGWRAFRYYPFDILPHEPDVGYNYQIVWLHRPAKKRWASYATANPDLVFNSLPISEEMRAWRDACANMVLALMRTDPARLTEADYGAIVEGSDDVFGKLKDKGWPLDPVKAREAVNPTWKRF